MGSKTSQNQAEYIWNERGKNILDVINRGKEGSGIAYHPEFSTNADALISCCYTAVVSEFPFDIVLQSCTFCVADTPIRALCRSSPAIVT
nr:hypothetical protein CFP56_34838 [Quercus suber]